MEENSNIPLLSQDEQLARIEYYFPELTDAQREQFRSLAPLYGEWNAKINVISRKDIGNLYLHHVLHSLGITCMLHFSAGSSVMDLGTGGGFPGIPLAILFPEVHFHLVDSIRKKIRVAQAVAEGIGLRNVSFGQARGEEVKEQYDFVVSRAVMPLADLVKLVRKNISKPQRNALPNGLICLKGGELAHEILPFKRVALTVDLADTFKEEYYLTKKVVYVPLCK